MRRKQIIDDMVEDETTISSSEIDSSDEEIGLLDSSWISATSTYNYMMKDPLLDWLKYHHGSLRHKNRKYVGNINKSLREKNSKYNFTSYIMKQGIIFERKVMKLITKKFGTKRVAEIHAELSPRDTKKAQETMDAMERGVPIIHSGMLMNYDNKTFGIPDLLVRSDWINFLVEDTVLSEDEENISAPELSKKWHYRVVDIKFTALTLSADGIHILNTGAFPAYKAQLLVYNWALGNVQGYTPDQTYILGRRWKYNSKGETYSGNSCFDKLGTIDYSTRDIEYIDTTKLAIEWVNEVMVDDASKWNITKYPLDRWELYPNMCNTNDYPWRIVKQQIAEDSKELTSLWMVGPKHRNNAIDNGIYKWTDKKCTPEVLGITGEKTSRILDAIIKVNQSKKVKISPKYIENNVGNWKHIDNIEFFVDFETCNGATSNIRNLPYANTETFIVVIGVGYIDPNTNTWVSKDFTINNLTIDEEARICREFSKFIRSKSKKYGVKIPRCIHWSSAERNMWCGAIDRHSDSDEWKSWKWKWLDLLEIFKEEPIVINGCMSFGLKDVVSAMKKHGFIQTSWNKNSKCVDGQSAMIAAYRAHDIAISSGISMRQVPIMRQIIEYNKVDVRVLYEIIIYLRENHINKSDYSGKPKRNKKLQKGTKRKLPEITDDKHVSKKRKHNTPKLSLLASMNDQTIQSANDTINNNSMSSDQNTLTHQDKSKYKSKYNLRSYKL